jgi:hypothetical protein
MLTATMKAFVERLNAPCVHLGTGRRRVECTTCAGRVELKVFACAVHGECTTGTRVDAVAACCQGCSDRAGASTLNLKGATK